AVDPRAREQAAFERPADRMLRRQSMWRGTQADAMRGRRARAWPRESPQRDLAVAARDQQALRMAQPHASQHEVVAHLARVQGIAARDVVREHESVVGRARDPGTVLAE